MIDERLVREIEEQPYRFVYATVTGDHLYGLAADDGVDYDVRACHVLPADEVLGLRPQRDSLAYTAHRDGLDCEVLSTDLGRLARNLLKKNGNVLEHVLSPLVILTTPAHEELRSIARDCASRHMAHHFAAHARMQWSLAEPEDRPPARNVLLALRVLLSGIHLMRTGAMEANLQRLNESFALPYLEDLLARPADRLERGFTTEYERLQGELERAKRTSALPELPPARARDRLSDLLVRLRLDR